jgi:uncharacterized protein YdhG (YjbR/CyaY superfamily)
MSPKKSARKSTRKSSTRANTDLFTAEEKAAMKDYIKEKKAARSGASVDNESEVLARIAQMSPSDRALATRIHQLVKANAPMLTSRLWYGMPAYSKDDKVVCFFQGADKFKTRYATLGFSDKAKLDDGPMWPNSFAIDELTPDAETRIAALVRKAVS